VTYGRALVTRASFTPNAWRDVALAATCMCMHIESMRTTIEMKETQRAELLKLAAQRGEKGFSALIGEAIDLYLAQFRARGEAVRKAKAVRGTLSDAEAEDLAASVRELRGRWR